MVVNLRSDQVFDRIEHPVALSKFGEIRAVVYDALDLAQDTGRDRLTDHVSALFLKIEVALVLFQALRLLGDEAIQRTFEMIDLRAVDEVLDNQVAVFLVEIALGLSQHLHLVSPFWAVDTELSGELIAGSE